MIQPPRHAENSGTTPAVAFDQNPEAMSSIPKEIFDRVRELALAIVNASAISDDVLHDSLCLSLYAYYEEQSTAGCSHPFLTEAMADYTADCAEAVSLYELSLEQAAHCPDEPTHTKWISMAERLIELGDIDRARAALQRGRAEAVRLGDQFWTEDADRLLQEIEPEL